MKTYQEMTREELLTLQQQLTAEYNDAKAKGLKLDMSRGKPAADQLDMFMGFMDTLNAESCMKTEAGMDVRNYGGLDGIPEAKKLIGDLMGVSADNVIGCGNSSLNIV